MGAGRVPLVTGATGFAGSHLIEHLLEHEPYVHGWGNPEGRRIPASANGRVTWTAVDVADADAVARALADAQPSAVYHCAGIADVERARADVSHALRVNVMGTHAVLDGLTRARLHDVPVLVTCSALVYKPSAEALSEQSPLAHSTPYGVTKLAQEMRAAAHPDRVLIVRPFNHAGPRQSAAFAMSSFARQIAQAEAGSRPPVLRVGNLDSRRDITDVRDTVRAYRLLVERGQTGEPYNVCRGTAYRVGDLLERLVGMSKLSIEVEVDPQRLRPSDNPIVLGDPGRLRSATGWSPQFTIDRTLSDLLDYWREAVAGGHDRD